MLTGPEFWVVLLAGLKVEALNTEPAFPTLAVTEGLAVKRPLVTLPKAVSFDAAPDFEADSKAVVTTVDEIDETAVKPD